MSNNSQTTVPELESIVPMDVAGRLGRLRELLGEANCDALLLSSLTNIAYLTGFTGSAAQLLVTTDRALFVTDGRYETQAPQQLADAGVNDFVMIEIGRTSDEQKGALIGAAAGVGRLGLESESVTWARATEYMGWFESATVVPTSGVVEQLRIVKDAGERSRMRAAAAVADAALAAVRHRLGEGLTERDFARELDLQMSMLGAVAPSFDTIVASGPNGALPHATPGDRVIAEGDLVVVDFGAIVDGYCSDMTRTFQIGEVDADRARMWDIVAESQRAGVAAVRAGATAAEVDVACRSIIDDAGWADAFSHGTGHGVGLDIHEAPRVAGSSSDTLCAAQVVTVEPGVYLPGIGGVRIEDTVFVTAEGCEPLTLAPKDPVVA